MQRLFRIKALRRTKELSFSNFNLEGVARCDASQTFPGREPSSSEHDIECPCVPGGQRHCQVPGPDVIRGCRRTVNENRDDLIDTAARNKIVDMGSIRVRQPVAVERFECIAQRKPARGCRVRLFFWSCRAFVFCPAPDASGGTTAFYSDAAKIRSSSSWVCPSQTGFSPQCDELTKP